MAWGDMMWWVWWCGGWWAFLCSFLSWSFISCITDVQMSGTQGLCCCHWCVELSNFFACRLFSHDFQAMEEALGMTRVVCRELLVRGKKNFLRRKLEEGGRQAVDDPTRARRLRQCAADLGVSLR